MADPPPFEDLKSAPWTPVNIAAAVKRLKGSNRQWKWKRIINSVGIMEQRMQKDWYEELKSTFKISRKEMHDHSTIDYDSLSD